MYKTIIAYCRQSAARSNETRETSLSLAAQEAEIRKWAEQQYLPVGEVFRDHDLRGYDPDRPELKAAIAALEPGDALVVYDLSRLARDNVLQEVIYRQIKERDAHLVSLMEPHAEEDLFRGLMGVINEHFRKQHGRRLAANFEQLARRGVFRSKPPFGYDKVDGKLVPNEHAPVIKQIFEDVASGRAFFSIAAEMHERYGDNSPFRWDHRNVNNIIRRWTYSGGVPYHDEVIWCDGGPCHPPIVSRELQERAIEMADERSYRRVKRKNYESVLEGKVIHECGQHAYLRYSGRDYAYATFVCSSQSKLPQCPVPRKQVSDRKLEMLVVEALQRDLLTVPEVVEDALELTEANYERQLPQINQRRKELMTRKSELVKRNERVVDLYTNGVRDRAWMLEQIETINREMAEIDHDLAGLPAAVDPALITEFATVMQSHRDALSFLSVEQASILLDTLGVVQYGPSGVTIRYHHPYDYLFPEPTVIPLTSANPHLRKRDRTQKTFGPRRETEDHERKRKASQKGAAD